MKNVVLLAGFVLGWVFTQAQLPYDRYPVYQGRDLGLTYSKKAAAFRIWSPTAQQAELLLYKDGENGSPLKILELRKSLEGTWTGKLAGDWKGTFYDFRVKIAGKWSKEVPDPYAKAVGVNGHRAMVVDLAGTNPPGWSQDRSPRFSKNDNPTDAIVYELHIRDASIDSSSGIIHKGKYLGLSETGTTNSGGLSTGLAHLKELGVTHVHLLPFFDFNSIDESKPDSLQYNWGYDPLNYNAPEGSYSTNPYDGVTRIRELKQLIEAFHKNGLRVVMDVVYNHTGLTEGSNFNQLVPGYYYRHNKDGSFSNATGCGNETASEMPMMRKFMLESVLYWEREYHIDGFRFDLMGVHDIKTMNLIADSLHRLKPDILLYGEGWTGGSSPLPDSMRAIKKNAWELHHIAVFSDDLRDGIKGSVFDAKDRGFASGNIRDTESVKFGIAASCRQPQINYRKVNYSREPYAAAPWNVISYCSCHDNNTLWDKLMLSCPDASIADRKKMQELALTIVLTSQGIPFLHAGSEFLRSKKGVENSFNAGDSINAINWNLKTENLGITRYVESLIRIRKQHPAFRMTTAAEIASDIRFDQNAPPGMIVYTLNGAAVQDRWKKIRIAFNGTAYPRKILLPGGSWKVAIPLGEHPEQFSGEITVDKFSAVILYQP